MNHIVVKSLSVRIAKLNQPILSDVSFTLKRGKIMAIVGPNGAGKSTLLKALAGDITPCSGQIDIDQLADVAKTRARQMAVLPQFSLLNFPYVVQDVVGLARIPHRTGVDTDRQIIQQALELMDIVYLQERLYTELSGGEKQRVQLARVLAQIWREDDAANKARVLLLDEPTAALDLGHQHQLMQALQLMANQGMSIIMVMHDINLAARYANKILALHHGQGIAVGSPKEVITAPIMSTLFNTPITIMVDEIHQSPVIVSG